MDLNISWKSKNRNPFVKKSSLLKERISDYALLQYFHIKITVDSGYRFADYQEYSPVGYRPAEYRPAGS